MTLVCDECKEQVQAQVFFFFVDTLSQKLTDSQGLAAQCKHMFHLVPQWQSSVRHERLKEVMADRPDLIQSELAVSLR